MFLVNENIGSANNAGTNKNTEPEGKFLEYLSTGIFLLAIVAVFVGLASGKWTRGNETRNVFDAMVQTRGCVVADIKNRVPSRYRCDHPVVGQYVEADVMREEARRVVDARYAKK